MTATDQQWEPPLRTTPDEVLAANLRRIREEHGLSRQALADLLTRTSGREWSRWRIVDLEGARTADRPPVSARWDEVIALCLGLDVTVFELVLPPIPNTTVVVQGLPTELQEAYGDPPTPGVGHSLKSDQYALALFALPAAVLSPDSLALAKDRRELYTDSGYLLENFQFLLDFARKITQGVQELPPELREGASD